MAVGRITGPLLAKNLLRDGVDLAFENDLLYLDVTTGRIGVKTTTPGYDLDVQGTTNVKALRVETTSTLGKLVISSSTLTTTMNNTLGDLVIKAPVESKILIQNDTIVSGNLHATGNITANGSVQIGNMTGSDTLSLYADIVSDITPQKPGQYNIGAPGKEWAQGYIDTLVASALTAPTGQDVNINPAPGFTANINGPIRVWGDNPLGTGPVTSNVLYVTPDGSDTNDGRAMDPSRACRTISGAIKSPFYKEGTSIKVAPGHYYENNPIELKPLTSVIGSDLRTTFVEPINKTQDLFHVRSGCYIAQMQMTNGQSGLLPGTGYTAGTNRGAYAVAFPPNYGGAKIDLYYSPYIQNCTNQSGPWLLDGTMFVPNQTVQVPTGVGVATWEYNTTTMLVTMEEGVVRVGDTINIGPTKPGYVDARTLLLANKGFFQEQVVAYIDQKYEYYGYDEDKCMRDTGLIVDSLIADLVFTGNGYTQSNFAGLQYWSQTEYTGLIGTELTTTTNAINYVTTLAQEVIQNITGGTRYQSTLTQSTGVAATSVEVTEIANEFNLITQILNTGTVGVTDLIEPNGITVVSTSSQRAYDLLQANKAYIQAEAVAYVESTKTPGFVYDQAKCYRDVGYMVDSVAFDILYGGNRQAIMSGVYYYGFSNTSSAIDKERPQTSAAYFRIREIVEQLITNEIVTKSPGNTSVQNTSLPAATSAEAVDLKEMVDLITSIINGGPDAALLPNSINLTRSTSTNVLRAANILAANKAFIIDEVIGYVEDRYNNGYAYNQPKCYRDTGLIVDSIAQDLIYNGDTQSAFAGLQYWNQGNYTGQISTEVSATIAAINYASSLAAQVVTNSTGTRFQSTVTQTFNFVYDETKCSRDTGLIVDAIALDLLFNGTSQSTFAGVQYWNHGGYVGEIAGELTTTTNAINYVKDLAKKVIINDLSGTRYQLIENQNTDYPDATGSEQTKLESEFTLITNILSTGTANITDWIQPNGISSSTVASVWNAYNSLQSNKEYIKAEAVAYVESTKTIGFVYDQAKCARDVGYMIDSISFDLLYGGNLQAITSGAYYYGYNNNSTTLPGEQAQAVQSYNYIRSILANIVTGVPLTVTYQSVVPQVTATSVGTNSEVIELRNKLDTITSIITSGTSVANAPEPIGLTRSTDSNVINAASILHANRDFLRAETIAYINNVIGIAGTVAEASTVTNEFGIISNIVRNGTLGVTDLIVPNGLPSSETNKTNSYDLLQLNKQYIQAETVAYINSTYQIFDQVKCARDTSLIVDALTQDLLFSTSSQTTFAGLQYWNQGSTEEVIPGELTTTTGAISHLSEIVQRIVTNDTAGLRYSTGTQVTDLSNPGTAAEATIVENEANLIINILTSGTSGVTDLIVPNGLSTSPDQDVINSYNLIQANRSYIQEEVIAYVEAMKTPGYVYDQALCARDTGYIVDSISVDLLYGGNRQAVQSGVYYYGFNGGASAIPGESENTIRAYQKLRELLSYAVQGISYPTPSQLGVVQVISTQTGTTSESSFVQSKVDLITNIINNGPSVVTAKTPISLTASTATSVQNAVSLLAANKSWLVAEVLAYISNPTEFTYDQSKCYRDVGYMIDCVSYDLLHGGNRQAVHAGVYYYSFNGDSTAIPNEIPQTVAAYDHIRNIVGKIVTNQTVTPTAGNTATQVKLTSTATSVEITALYNKLDVITNIINNGPGVAPAPAPISQTITTSTSAMVAYDLLLANKEFIQAETVAYVNQFDTGFVYNRAKCIRDIGIVVENIAYDVAFGGNEKSREAGLAYWNGVTSYISNEITETTDAFAYLDSLAQNVITNTTATNLLNTYQKSPQVFNSNLTGGDVAGPVVTKLVSIINDIIANGPSVAPVRQPGNGPDWGTVSAEVLLQTNRSFIQNEIIAWINDSYPEFSYREDKCYRDMGWIVDAITQDIVLNGNVKTIEAAKTYWTGNKSVLENAAFGNRNQVVETIAAINHARDVALQVINNTTVTTTAFVFDPTRCSRDTGLIVDSLAQDLLFQGDSQTTFAGIQYWNHGDYVGDVAQQLTTTTAAINYISDLAQKVVQNVTTGVRYQSTVSQVTTVTAATISEANIIAKNFSTVTNILTNGVVGVTDTIIPNSLTSSGNVNVQNAFKNLQVNMDYLKAEAIAFIEETKNFRYDQTKCERDSGLIVDSIVMDMLYPSQHLSQSTFSGLQYWNQNGYTGLIETEVNTTTNAITYLAMLAGKVVQNDVSGLRYQSVVTQVLSTATGSSSEAITINDEFTLIKTILNNGTAGVTDIVVPNGLTPSAITTVQNAYDLLIANKEYLIAETIAYVEAVKAFDFVYNSDLCARDVSYMLDSVAFDLLHGGNRQAIHSGVYYYTFNADSSAIPTEQPQTVAAFQFIKTLSAQLVQNVAVKSLQNVVAQDTSLPSASADAAELAMKPVERVINIIENGPGVVGSKEPINLTRVTSGDIQRAAAILDANREFIVAETIAFINDYITYQYDRETCARDVEYIVNSVAFDMLYGGNKQSVQSGVYYWGYSNSSTSLPKERVASTLAYQYMKQLMGEIVLAQTTGTRYQSVLTQTTNLPTATAVEVEVLGQNIDKIITIINDGPEAAGKKKPISLFETDNQYVRNAVNLLSANREYIRAEVIAYVEDTQVSNDQIILPFYDMGANASLSVIRNFDLLATIIEHGPEIAPPETAGNGIFVKTGLSPNDTKVAPVITSVTTVSTGTYLIEIDQSTVGYGDAQSLYFGQTAVFPLLDADVPDEWSIRRLNPIGSMGGALIDGGVISDRSPIESFVFDAFTQVNQGGQGIKVTNNGYAQLVSVFTIFCANAVTVENGGICSITNSNSNFGDICLTAKGYGSREFSGYIKNPPVLPYYPNGVYPQGGQVQVYVADPDLRPHISLVMEVEPPSGFVNVQGLPGFLSGAVNIDVLTTGTIDITGVDTSGFCIGQKFYVRDQYGRNYDSNNQPYVKEGTIVADVNYQTITLNYPLNSGGGEPGNPNYFNLYSCGNAYYTVLSSALGPDPIPPGTLLLPNQQNVQEAVSLDYIFTLTEKIVNNDPVGVVLQTTSTQVFDYTQVGGTNALPFIRDRLQIISDILVNGSGATPEVSYYGTTPSGAGAAASLLRKNRTFVQDELIAHVDDTFFSFSYDQAKCARDTGLIVDSLAQDLLFKSNSQSVFSAIQYWNQESYTGKIASELTTTTAAINYVKTLAKNVVQGIVAPGYSTATQVTNLTLATSAEATTIGSDFDVILNILNTGTAGVTDIIVPNSLTSSTNINVVRAYNLLQANKEYIQEEAVAFVEATKTGVRYNQEKCERDAGLIVDAIALDLAFPTLTNSQASFAGLSYWNQTSYTGQIAGELTTTTNAINYLNDLTQKIVQNDVSGTRYQSTLTQSTTGTAATAVEANFLDTEFTLITTILNTGTAGVTDLIRTGGIVASTSTTTIRAYNNLMANKAYLQSEVVAYVEATKTPGFTYDQAKCYRDAGYMIDSVAFDLLYGGNRQAVQSAVYYYDFNSGSTAIPGEATTTTNAFAFLGTLSQQIVKGIAVTPRQTRVTQVLSASTGTNTDATVIGTEVSYINTIINSGPGLAASKEPISLTKTASPTTINAANLLLANRDFIVAETIAYINQEFGFDYDKDLCFRDVGYMIDAVSVDLLYGGNRQAVQSGVYYYSYSSTSSAIVGEIPQTVSAYEYIASLTEAIILGNEVAAQQTTVPRVTGVGGTAAEANSIKELLTHVTGIITNGPDSTIVNVPLPVYASTSTAAQNAAMMLDANRDFIVAETVAYVDYFNTPGYEYDKVKCARDTGLLVDAIAQDILFESFSQSIFSGVQYWNHGSYVGDIANELTTTTNAVTYLQTLVSKVVTNDTTGVRYQGDVVQNTSLTAATSAEGSTLAADLDVIKNIITTGVAGVTDIIVPNSVTASTTASVVRAFNILNANRDYIQAEVVAFVESTKTAGFEYNQDKCYRDVGYMLDAIAVDLLYGGNRQAVQSGVYYYGYNASSTALPGEQAQAIDAYNYIKSILPSVIKGQSLASTYQSGVAQVTSGSVGTDDEAQAAQYRMDIVTNIIDKGPVVSAIKQPLSTIRSTNQNIVNAANLIDANREWIVAEVIAYVNKKYSSYNRVKCHRDVGLLVDALIYDLEKGGNYNAIIAGRSYYAEHGTHHIVQLEENVTDPSLFPDGAITTFYQRSYMSASGYLFEYVGSGVTYGSLPQRGVKDPVQSKETVQLNNGKVFFTSTDQNGDFRIGTGLVISQATGVLSGRTFTKSLFANLTPFILAIEG